MEGKHHFGRSAGYLCLCLLLLFVMGIPAGAVPQEPEETGSQRPVVAVHYAPTTRSMVIGYLESGTALTVLAEAGSFYEIDCYDMTGFIAKELVLLYEDKYYVNHNTDKQDTSVFYSRPLGEILSKKRTVYSVSLPLQGIPYVWAGSSTRGFDCSGLTQYILRHVEISVARTCEGQMGQGLIISKEMLQCGDLVFFQNTTEQWSVTSHVGIYLGDGKLLHAGIHGVAVVDLDSQYYTEHYLCARRYLLTDLLLPNMPTAIGAISAADTGKQPLPADKFINNIQKQGVLLA